MREWGVLFILGIDGWIFLRSKPHNVTAGDMVSVGSVVDVADCADEHAGNIICAGTHSFSTLFLFCQPELFTLFPNS